MPLIHSLLHLTDFQSPLLRTLVPSISLAFALQTSVAIPSILAQTDRIYDPSGSLTYLSCAALSLYLPAFRATAAAGSGSLKPAWPSLLAPFIGNAASTAPTTLHWRQVLLSSAVTIWATRRTSFHPSPPSASTSVLLTRLYATKQ